MHIKLFSRNCSLQVARRPDLRLESGQLRPCLGSKETGDHLQVHTMTSPALARECKVEGWRGQRLLLLASVAREALGQLVDTESRAQLWSERRAKRD